MTTPATELRSFMAIIEEAAKPSDRYDFKYELVVDELEGTDPSKFPKHLQALLTDEQKEKIKSRDLMVLGSFDVGVRYTLDSDGDISTLEMIYLGGDEELSEDPEYLVPFNKGDDLAELCEFNTETFRSIQQACQADAESNSSADDVDVDSGDDSRGHDGRDYMPRSWQK